MTAGESGNVDDPNQAVIAQPSLANQLSQTALGHVTQELELEQPILGKHKALGSQRIIKRICTHIGHTVFASNDLNFARQGGHRYLAGQLVAIQSGNPQRRYSDQDNEDDKYFFHKQGSTTG